MKLKKKNFSKYLQIFKITWQNIFVYRINFFVWRLRSLITFLGIYFFWEAIYFYNDSIGPYKSREMLTYILLSSLLQSLVLSSRTPQMGSDISRGTLSKHLMQPFKYLRKLFFIDVADKAANVFFLIFELSGIFLILKPPFIVQNNILNLLSFFVAMFLSLLLFYYMSLVIGLLTFWYPENHGWPMRFLFNVSNRFLSGSYVPLNVLPSFLGFLQFFPSAFLIYFPLQVYLGKLSQAEIFAGLGLMLIWILLLKFFSRYMWNKGLKNYTAAGI